jgi:dihydrofolate reductase
MRKIIASVFSTLDGVVERPGEDGWTGSGSDDSTAYSYDLLFTHDALLLGRVTYEGFARAWPTMEGTGDFGDRMNTMPKYVVSKTLDKAEWAGTTVLSGDLAEEISTLKRQPGGDILIYGSGELVTGLIQHGLIDELRLWVHPVVLGRGKRLFADGSAARLKLIDTTTFTSGVVVLTYGPDDQS